MHSTLKLRESDPHDLFAIEPEPVPVAWADKVLADIQRDARIHLPETAPLVLPPAAGSGTAAAPAVDTTFHATAADDTHVPEIHVPEIHVPSDGVVDRPSTGKWAKSLLMLIFAVGSAAAAAAWQQHGDAAKQLISNWAPAFALTSSPPTENIGVAVGQSDTPAVQAAAADPSPAQPPPVRPPESAAPAAAAPSPEPAQLQLQSMARDLAAMGQQIEQLKASVAELKASQQVAARDVVKPAEAKASAPNPRPRLSAPPPRLAAAPARRPMPAYTPVQAAAPAPLPPPPLPQSAPPPSSLQPAPSQQSADQFDEPVVRPPMPLR